MNAKKQYRITYPDGTIALAMGTDGVSKLLGVSEKLVKECLENDIMINDCKIERLQFVYQSVEQMNLVLSGFHSESDNYLAFEEEQRKANIEAYHGHCCDTRKITSKGYVSKEMRNGMARESNSGGWYI